MMKKHLCKLKKDPWSQRSLTWDSRMRYKHPQRAAHPTQLGPVRFCQWFPVSFQNYSKVANAFSLNKLWEKQMFLPQFNVSSWKEGVHSSHGNWKRVNRYCYFYYIAEVLWNSSLKQPAEKTQTPKKLRFSLTSVPNRNNFISLNTCYSTGILWNQVIPSYPPSLWQALCRSWGTGTCHLCCKSLPPKPLHCSI